jgi:hypothetical protein
VLEGAENSFGPWAGMGYDIGVLLARERLSGSFSKSTEVSLGYHTFD